MQLEKSTPGKAIAGMFFTFMEPHFLGYCVDRALVLSGVVFSQNYSLKLVHGGVLTRPWINVHTGTVPHYGFKYWMEQPSTGNTQYYRCFF